MHFMRFIAWNESILGTSVDSSDYIHVFLSGAPFFRKQLLLPCVINESAVFSWFWRISCGLGDVRTSSPISCLSVVGNRPFAFCDRRPTPGDHPRPSKPQIRFLLDNVVLSD